MAYATLDMVRAILPKDHEITAESKPNIPQVAVWIVQADATYDVALSGPLTGDEASKAAAICSGEVAYRVMFTRLAGNIEGTEWMRYHQDFMLATGQVEDANGGLSFTVTPKSRTMEAVDDSSTDSIQPAFMRDQSGEW